MSKVSRATGNKRLLQLAEFLEKLPMEKFDFSAWGQKRECGTVACALGWAPSLPFAKNSGISLEPVLWSDYMLQFTKNESIIYEEQVARELFGIGGEAMAFLFTPDGDFDSVLKFGNNGLRVKSGAKKVAANIRRFVAIRSA